MMSMMWEKKEGKLSVCVYEVCMNVLVSIDQNEEEYQE